MSAYELLAIGFIAGAIVATACWVVWAWRAMNPKVSPGGTAQ